ncbi:electron transfer flavoprotein subunit beta/FixA family protein [Hominifimenecus sp. rT4P-3]|uniref:electron transfer flavoprotein subunit beta/FixA family protein n=1 Tax=Hominifimenecus sp. rT4P-3 TaxID=3242979 RepID=UPI003DA5B7EF
MNLVVCMKAVPSTNTVRLDPVTHTIIRDGRQAVVNPFDASALEEAVRIKEQLGGTVTALSMGIPDTERLLRDALGRGADEGVLLSDRAFAGADTLATSYALACEIRQMPPVSLILCGKMAVDGDTAQIGPELAGALGIPCITDVYQILDISETHVRVRRGVDGGQMVVETSLPALITVVKDICDPRMPSISGVRFGENGPVAVKTAAQVQADLSRVGLNGSPTQVVKTFTPERTTESIPVLGTPKEQAGKLMTLIKEMSV